MLWLRKYQVLSTGQIIVGVILVWTWQFWSYPVTLASVIFIFHLKVIEVVNSCCCLVRILYFYSSYKIDFKFLEKFKDRLVRREGFGEWYDGGELIHLLYLLSIEQPRTWTSLCCSNHVLIFTFVNHARLYFTLNQSFQHLQNSVSDFANINYAN